MEKLKERLKEYIENINELGSDAQKEDNYDVLRTDLECIVTWCSMATVVINRIKSLEKRSE